MSPKVPGTWKIASLAFATAVSVLVIGLVAANRSSANPALLAPLQVRAVQATPSPSPVGTVPTSPTATPQNSTPAATPSATPSSPVQEPSVRAASPNSPQPQDGPYVAAVCSAFDAYLTGAAKLIVNDPALAVDQRRFIREVIPSLDALVGGLLTADPPADVRDYHNQVLATVQDAALGARSGRLTSFDDLNRLGTGLKLPSPETQARLETLAARTPQCQSRGGKFFIG